MIQNKKCTSNAKNLIIINFGNFGKIGLFSGFLLKWINRRFMHAGLFSSLSPSLCAIWKILQHNWKIQLDYSTIRDIANKCSYVLAFHSPLTKPHVTLHLKFSEYIKRTEISWMISLSVHVSQYFFTLHYCLVVLNDDLCVILHWRDHFQKKKYVKIRKITRRVHTVELINFSKICKFLSCLNSHYFIA